MANDSTTRFSNRVEDYIRYRPHYPVSVMDFLRSQLGLRSSDVIADIGSGTGISSMLFLENGNTVWGIEPNREMREAAERQLSHYKNFKSADGTAENIPLPDKSVDMIVAGQAFHWFDMSRSREEFARVLKQGRYAVLIWNDRKTESDAFSEEYDALLSTLEDYRKVNHKNVDRPVFDEFYGKRNYDIHIVPNHQDFDWEGLKGRLMSSSYVPVPGDPAHEPLMKRMKEIFDKYNINGKVKIEYDTKIVHGKLS
jgi:ubiquinone/menaquinone biosynthesis C-methylase UbiE